MTSTVLGCPAISNTAVAAQRTARCVECEALSWKQDVGRSRLKCWLGRGCDQPHRGAPGHLCVQSTSVGVNRVRGTNHPWELLGGRAKVSLDREVRSQQHFFRALGWPFSRVGSTAYSLLVDTMFISPNGTLSDHECDQGDIKSSPWETPLFITN